MDHKQLRAFITIAKTGNMTRAADELHVVQPAVSRQIQLLEHDLGAKLFDRDGRGMTLTAAGSSLLGYAQRAMLELDRARAELASASGEVAGIVTVGLLPSVVNILPTPFIRAVSEQYPKVRMRLTMGYGGNLKKWLENGEVDAALLYGVEHEAQFQSLALVNEPLWLVGPASSTLQRSQPVTLDHLARHPMILPSGPQGVRAIVDHACAISGIDLDVKLETNAMEIQKNLVIGGVGFTILPPVSFAREYGEGQLKGAPIAAAGFERTIVLAVPAIRTISRHVRSVLDLLVDCTRAVVKDQHWPEARWVGRDGERRD
jgi:DNA-binding transcriptional LysR family regulator